MENLLTIQPTHLGPFLDITYDHINTYTKCGIEIKVSNSVRMSHDLRQVSCDDCLKYVDRIKTK